MAPSVAHRVEVQVSKSPAEFFAENQAIAGFDNMGKSLYTTLRELIENSLDACESVQILPDISVHVEELTQKQFNVIRGLVHEDGSTPAGIRDAGLFAKTCSKKRKSIESAAEETLSEKAPSEATSSMSASKTPRKKASQEGYFRIKVRDNGCGMSHDAIPNLLGRVLSGSKYGVRQTRGKFGLGAKMALIWSKKSTGVPIKIKTSHMPSPNETGEFVSTCVLDIDIFKNRPRVIEHTKTKNTESWVGTEFEVLIAGNWTTYKSRVVQYLQQLAIITPYAKLEMTYVNLSDEKRNMNIRYDRRSEQMPPPAKEVKHHPSSVNNLLVQQLLERTQCKTFINFLCTDLSSVSPALARRLITELGHGFDETIAPSEVTDKQVTRLVQLLRSVELFKAPDGSCLSPLGEYNLNLGIRKVLEPDLVATARDKPSAYEGHPFIVEAAVSLGGKDVKEGITVIRFANRIPLLFEGGADVATRVAQNKIKWSTYKIDHKRDKIGVFVSIVSTKVPFKGTGKEYIGDDITEIQHSVKRALQSCCQQLRVHLAKKHAMKDIKERKSRLVKYVPNVSQALYGLLDGMRKRKAEEGSQKKSSRQKTDISTRMRLDESAARNVLQKLDREITEASIQKCLIETIEASGVSAEDLEAMKDKGGKKCGVRKKRGLVDDAPPLYLVPLSHLEASEHDIEHHLFTFRPIKQVPVETK
jgi:DNA topoisomerase VI B subunit